MMIGPTVEKIWGTTQVLVMTPMFEMHRLVIKPFHRCSYHRHVFKHNSFYVLHGTLYIDVQRSGSYRGKAVDSYTLNSGDTFSVPPGIRHQFRTGPGSRGGRRGAPCLALEMYYTEPLSEDIIRTDKGGPYDQEG